MTKKMKIKKKFGAL